VSTMSKVVRSLSPYQAQFIEQFLSDSSERQQLLVGPPQSGLAECAREIIFRIMAEGQHRRNLVLTLRARILQWLQQLQEEIEPALLLEGSRRNLRQLSGAVKLAEYAWPEDGVVVMDAWAFERFPDLQSSVVHTPWDLVVWDRVSIPPVSRRVELLNSVRDSQHDRRLLVISSDRLSEDFEFEPLRMKKTVWDRSMIDRSERGLLEPDSERETVNYIRTGAEREIKKSVEDLAQRLLAAHGRPREFAPERLVFPPADRLVHAVESSPAAVQEALHRLRPSKPTMILRQDELFKDSEPIETQDEPQLSEEIANLQDIVDGLSYDSKLEAFLAYLKSHFQDGSRFLIICRFSATARYLKSAMVDTELPASVATGDLPPKEILTVLNEFSANGRILVATANALQGVELDAEIVIIYDFDDWPWTVLKSRIRPRQEGIRLRIVRLCDSAEGEELQDGFAWEN
jgi:hypothetical protein